MDEHKDEKGSSGGVCKVAVSVHVFYLFFLVPFSAFHQGQRRPGPLRRQARKQGGYYIRGRRGWVHGGKGEAFLAELSRHSLREDSEDEAIDKARSKPRETKGQQARNTSKCARRWRIDLEAAERPEGLHEFLFFVYVRCSCHFFLRNAHVNTPSLSAAHTPTFRASLAALAPPVTASSAQVFLVRP